MKFLRFFGRILIVALVVCLIGLVYLRKTQPETGQTSVQPNENVAPSPVLQSPGLEYEPESSPEPTEEPEPTGPPLPDIDLNDWKYKLVNKDYLRPQLCSRRGRAGGRQIFR